MKTMITFHDGTRRTSVHGPFCSVEMMEHKLLVQEHESGPRWVLARFQQGGWRHAGETWPSLRFGEDLTTHFPVTFQPQHAVAH